VPDGGEGVETVDGEGGGDLHDEPVPDVPHGDEPLLRAGGVRGGARARQDPRGREMERELARRLGRAPRVPAFYIGSTDKIMSLHLAGKLVPRRHMALNFASSWNVT